MDTIKSKETKLVTDSSVDEPFTASLQNMRRVSCDEPQDLSAKEVAALFGNDVSAYKPGTHSPEPSCCPYLLEATLTPQLPWQEVSLPMHGLQTDCERIPDKPVINRG